jgi:hypothetical protein
MTLSEVILGAPSSDGFPRAGSDLSIRIESFIRSAPNNAFLQAKLTVLDAPERLLLFLHRFLIFNDALAARVPYLAGLIHLTPDLFVDPETPCGFLGQLNGRIAAHVAEAASDEYRMSNGRNMAHQHLSQVFFRGALAFYGPESPSSFEIRHPAPAAITALLAEARSKFFVAPTTGDIFAGLGFHIGLEFFANEEFNLVDRHLCARHAALVETLKRGGDGINDYTWLSLHTVVEIGHYNAGLEAVREAVALYRDRAQAPQMAERIMDGLDAFSDLQQRYYKTVFAEVE